MLDFRIINKKQTSVLQTNLNGKALLTIPQLNKGTAFTAEERKTFQLLGKLPAQIETLDQQLKRVYKQYASFRGHLNRHIYLNNLHDTNQVLFYALVSKHLDEMLPVIYTPIVGTAVKHFSREFRQTRGLYITYNDRHHLSQILKNRSHPDIDVAVVTDGEGVLGIGDQGVGGMDIPIAKLMVYTLCGGISPLRTLPILLDVGTNNQTLLNDPMYLGWRHERISESQYDEFIEKFIDALKKECPQIFLHWEDLSSRNAHHNLNHYQDRICTFNDDMQGTGAVSLAALMAVSQLDGRPLSEHRIVIFGAGTAGTGIAYQFYHAIQKTSLSESEARQCFWLLDRPGLLLKSMRALHPSQSFFARSEMEVKHWKRNALGCIDLLEVVKRVKPTVLIGCSAQAGAFNEAVIRALQAGVEHPVILPLSNPNDQSEATPSDLVKWTDNKGRIATGSPFEPIHHHGQYIPIAQNNNALIFPGIGLGVIACKARQTTNAMLNAACRALAESAPILKDPDAPLLPLLSDAPSVARKIAIAVAKQAHQEGLAQAMPDDLEAHINKIYWSPHYLPYEIRGGTRAAKPRSAPNSPP